MLGIRSLQLLSDAVDPWTHHLQLSQLMRMMRGAWKQIVVLMMRG